jgi:quercetin dioxygenase-like cupin family protein
MEIYPKYQNNFSMPINTKKLIDKLKQEKFAHVFEWSDKPNTEYPEHAHKGKVSFYIIRGSVTFSGDIKITVNAGERFDVPVGVKHSAVVGPEGCEWVVGEEIEGDS